MNAVAIQLFPSCMYLREDKVEALLSHLARTMGKDTSITSVDDYHNAFVTLRHEQPGGQKALTGHNMTRESIQGVRLHLTRLLACIHSNTMPLVKEMDARPMVGCPGCQYPVGMEWRDDPSLPRCCKTQVAHATLLYGAYRSLDVLFFSETKVESEPRFDAARAHLPRDVAEVPVHPSFRDFREQFMNFCAHLGYTRPHPLPAYGDGGGVPARPDAPARGGGSSPHKLYPGRLQQILHHTTLWVLLWNGDDATSGDASSSDVSSLRPAVVDNDGSDGVHIVTVILRQGSSGHRTSSKPMC